MAKDPCIGVCDFRKKTGFCKACFRTREEKRRWKDMGTGERREVARKIVERMAARLERCI